MYARYTDVSSADLGPHELISLVSSLLLEENQQRIVWQCFVETLLD
uniref:Uncharacterized protein n=1 Tax=Arundo donax TaxID=35708 RepID=A0A0A9HGY8_ARUDO